MRTTRFCPAASSGALHLGHLIPAFGAVLQAVSTGGAFVVKAEYKADPDSPSVIPPLDHLYDGPEWTDFATNLAAIRRLIPGIRLVTTVENADLMQILCGDDRNPSAALDALLGVDCIVRGQEWNPKFSSTFGTPVEVQGIAEFAASHQAVLEELAGHPLQIWYVPLLLDTDGVKISKLFIPESLTLRTAWREGHTNEHLFA